MLEEALDAVVVRPTVVTSFSSIPIRITPVDLSSTFLPAGPFNTADFPDEREIGRDKGIVFTCSISGKRATGND